MEEVLKIIAQSSFALLAIVGTFVIFKLQWFRREIDDYKGRLIETLYKKDRLKSDTAGFNMPDKEFRDFAEKYPEYGEEPVERGKVKSKYKDNFAQLNKRIEGKLQLVQYIKYSCIALAMIFFLCLIILSVECYSECFQDCIKYIAIAITFIVYIFIIKKLIKGLKDF